MEWAIPIQSFDPKHVGLGSFQATSKQLVPLSYQEGPYRFSSLNLLWPTLNVKSYDPPSGRLVLSMTGNTMTQTKLNYFQELLFTNITRLQDQWFPSEPKKDLRDIRKGFQPFLDSTNLYLYCPTPNATGGVAGGTVSTHDIQYYSNGVWSQGSPPASRTTAEFFEVGKPIRIAIRICGLSFQQHAISGMWTGKFRLQHKLLAIYSD